MTTERILNELVSLRETMTAGFSRVDRYFELQQGQHLELRGDVNELRAMVVSLIDRVDRIEVRLGSLEQTVQRLDSEVRALRDWATHEFAEVRSELRQMREQASQRDATLRRDVDGLLARVDRLEDRLG